MSIPPYDVVIRDGQVIDGLGTEPVSGDIGVRGDRIEAVGDLSGYDAKCTIDASGQYVIPGFIDMHTHAERGLPYPELAASVHHLTQGVTTVLCGADGYGAWPIYSDIGALSEKLMAQGIGTNAALMVGLGQVRRQVMGLADRLPTGSEVEAMKERLRLAMEGGAVGISSGLVFAPDRYVDTDGIIDIAREVAPYGGIYHTHIRDEADGLLEAVQEAIDICEGSGVTTVITHFKAVYRRNWGKLREATDVIAQARRRGVKIYADQFPFVEGGPMPLIPPDTWLGASGVVEERVKRISSILESLPMDKLLHLYLEMKTGGQFDVGEREFLGTNAPLLRQMIAGGIGYSVPPVGTALHHFSSWLGTHQGPGNPDERARFAARLSDSDDGMRIRAEVERHIANLGGHDKISITGVSDSNLNMKTLGQAAEILGQTEVETAITLALRGAEAFVILHSEEDVEYAMQQDFVATGSDGDYPYFGEGKGKLGGPQAVRAYSTFATKLRKYATERNTITLAHAVRAGTSLPASILGWEDRGVIREGAVADIAVFDPKSIRPRSNLSDPHQYSEGVNFVVVNGKLALDNGQPTGVLAGSVVGRSG
jgi:N-acyl-D-aspartate/D-glutamate deacylase